jgi:hypothetical protein
MLYILKILLYMKASFLVNRIKICLSSFSKTDIFVLHAFS